MTPTAEGAVLVTGASSGIGWATVAELLQRGHRVLAGARKDEDLANLDKLGATAIKLDVTRQSDLEALATKLEEHAPIAGLVNNAGVVRGGPWECIDLDHLRQQMEVNFIGVVAVTQAALPHLRRSRGRIVNISSISGRVAGSLLGPYSASKFALEAFTDSLRRELASLHVKVVSINPGPISTGIWQKRDAQVAKPEDLLRTDEQRRAYGRLLEIFLKRLDQASAMADPVDLVVEKILRALTDPRPKTRYYVGKQMWALAQIVSVLPDRWLDVVEKSR